MVDFTRHERIVLVSLAVVLLVGTILHHAVKVNSRLSHVAHIFESDKLYQKIDINKATLEQLDNLPGVGPVTARRILDYRTQEGVFTNLDELKNVSGISNFTYKKIVKFLKVLPQK